jgi:hypothetical protein
MLNWAYISFYIRPKMILTDIIKNKAFILKKIMPAASKFLNEGFK